MMPWFSIVLLAASILAVLYGAHMGDRGEYGEQAMSSMAGGLLLIVFGFVGMVVSAIALLVWLV